jgi:hypothetical protein
LPPCSRCFTNTPRNPRLLLPDKMDVPYLAAVHNRLRSRHEPSLVLSFFLERLCCGDGLVPQAAGRQASRIHALLLRTEGDSCIRTWMPSASCLQTHALNSDLSAPLLLPDPPHSRNHRIRPYRALLLCNDPLFMRTITRPVVGGEQSRGAEKSMHAPRAQGKVPRVCRRQSCHHDHGWSSSFPATFFKFFPSYQRHTFLDEGARNTKRTRRLLIEDPAKFGVTRQRRLPASRKQAGVQ